MIAANLCSLKSQFFKPATKASLKNAKAAAPE
jgi:hypothetical protein